MDRVTWEEVSDTLRTLVAGLIVAGPNFGLDTETMIRLWCAGKIRVSPAADFEQSEQIEIEMVPQGREHYRRR